MSPMGTGVDSDGGFSEQTRAYFERRAEGGFALIHTGCTCVSVKYEPRQGNLLDKLSMVGTLNRVAESVHQQGGKLSCELLVGCGRYGFAAKDPHDDKEGGDGNSYDWLIPLEGSDLNNPPFSSSPTPWMVDPSIICRQYSIEQLHDIEKSFALSAKFAKDAGCDAITILADGGYLIDQFITPLWNWREDEYGGSFENRMRFLLNLIAGAQETCGKDFPIIVKFTVTHCIEGGRSVEEGIEVAKRLEKAGVAALIADQGFTDVWYKNIPTVYNGYGSKIETAAKVQKAVNIPVGCDGNMGDPAIARKAVQEGKISLVLMGRQCIADPDWPKKVMAGNYDDIRYCIGCSECMNDEVYGRYNSCSINPSVAFENFSEVKPAEEPKNVLVVGGGPGGMETALTAAERGHKVTIWEKDSRLGGVANGAGKPRFKLMVRNYIRYMINQVMKNSNITVVYNKKATSDNIRDFGADKIVLAIGGVQSVPPIPGLKNNPNVDTAVSYMTDHTDADGNVIIIGAGLVGTETALDLQEKGRHVVLVEALGGIAVNDNMQMNNRMMIEKMVADSNLETHFNTMVKRAEADRLIIEEDGKESEIPYDKILVATGMRANLGLQEELEPYYSFDELFTIGDAAQKGLIKNAVHQGFGVAKNQL